MTYREPEVVSDLVSLTITGVPGGVMERAPLPDLGLQGGRIKVRLAERGEIIDLSHLAADHNKRSARFNFGFVDLNGILTGSINSEVPVSDRWNNGNTDPRVSVLGFRSPARIDELLADISKIAMMPTEEVWERGLEQEYRDKLAGICQLLHTESEWGEIDGTLVPLRGGALIADMLPLPKALVVAIDSKRIPLKKENEIGIGLNLPGSDVYPDRIPELWAWMDRQLCGLHDKRLRILEAAVGSGATTVAYISLFVAKGIKPAHIELVAPVVSQQGVQLALKMADQVGIPISVVAGQMFYKLGNYWEGIEDSLQYNNGRWVIGKATTILEKFLRLERYNPVLE